MLTLAFEILAERIDPPALAVRLVKALASAAGADGMIAGQVADLEAENADVDADVLHYIHLNKTAKMFRCATLMGALCAEADESQIQLLSDYGLKIGLGFQIADDILDVSASSKDERAGKMTYPALMGIEKAKQLARQLTREAIDLLAPFGPDAYLLEQLALALMHREK